MGDHPRSSSSVFAYGLLIPWLLAIMCTTLPCSGARPLSAQLKAPSLQVHNHRQYDDHEATQHINEGLQQSLLRINLHPSDVMVKNSFKPLFTMLPKGPVSPSGPSPATNRFPNADSTDQISTRSVSDQP